jgi:tetratricopeptide (TPR) repeat protein
MSPHQLGELASSSVLPWKGLYDVARLASYMDGPNRAQPLYRAALERAEATSKRAGKWSPVEVVALHGLASAFVLEYRDAAAAAKTLKILMAGGDDRAASVATLVHYGSLCEWLGVDRSAEAVAMLQKRLSAASDLSVSQVAELQWARGRALFAGGQYAEALNPLRIAASTNVDRPFVDQANVLFIKAMIRAGNTTAAQAEYDRMAANERTRPILVLDKDLLRELRGEMPVEPGRVTSKGKTTK